MLNTSFLQYFDPLSDPRIERSKEHLLIDIVAIAICAIISSAEGRVGIETYGKAKYEWLTKFSGTPLIVKKKADYLLALKGNQKRLHKAVKQGFEQAKQEEFLGREHSYCEQVEAGHHRVEKRQAWKINVSELNTPS
ncbi:MAG: transposase family protein [Cyanobacteriota bacterium]|nr:transposase family protein [Cyanobacteriota bacterium]